MLVQGQIRLDELDGQLTVEQARYQELRTEVAAMESPSRVVAAAEALGMVAPQDLVYLQPEAPDPSAGATPTAPADAAGDPTTSRAVPTTPGATMKPLLETPAP